MITPASSPIPPHYYDNLQPGDFLTGRSWPGPQPICVVSLGCVCVHVLLRHEVVCAAAYSISRAEQDGPSYGLLSRLSEKCHIRLQSRPQSRGSPADLIPHAWYSRHQADRAVARQREAENHDTLLEQDALLICRLGDGTDSAELKEEFHVPAVLNVI